MRNPKPYDVVILLHDLDEFHLTAGVAGTIVESLGDGEAFIVEFIDRDGDTVALLTLPPVAVRQATKAELRDLPWPDSQLKGIAAPIADAMYLADKDRRPTRAG